MSCSDCNGTGKYQPLFGPPEDCAKCGGTGANPAFIGTPMRNPAHQHVAAMGGNSASFDPNIVRVHIIQPNSPFRTDVGDWRFFDTQSPGKTIDTIDAFEGEYVGFRMLACDFRDKKNTINVVYDDDDPKLFNSMADEDARLGTGGGMAVGPDIQIKVGLITCWWHAYSKTNSNKILLPSACSPNGLFHVGYLRSIYEFKSVQMSTKMGHWWAPSIVRK